MFVWYRRRQRIAVGHLLLSVPSGCSYGGLVYAEEEGRFYGANGDAVSLTPMQHQLMEMFFHSPTHTLTKTEICNALWPKKPDANDTLYTLIRRLKPVVEQHSNLKIESDRSKAYRLVINQIEN
jgi:DNA-binding response OmpR family regulator